MFRKIIQPPGWYKDKKVTVVGLGAFGGGAGVTRFLHSLGARLTVTDIKPAAELAKETAALADLEIRWVLGEHRDGDLLEADLVVLNPAIPRGAPLVERCRKAGVPLETEMNLFFKHCRGKICAITGSNGKTTTTSLVAEMARRRWPGILIGGNIGRSLLPVVDEIAEEDWVILELSSFQLADLASLGQRPAISVITNLSENPLDWHGSYHDYLEAKREILLPGPPPDLAVLNRFDPVLREWAAENSRRLVTVSPPGEQSDGVTVDLGSGNISAGGPDGEVPLFARVAETSTCSTRRQQPPPPGRWGASPRKYWRPSVPSRGSSIASSWLEPSRRSSISMTRSPRPRNRPSPPWRTWAPMSS